MKWCRIGLVSLLAGCWLSGSGCSGLDWRALWHSLSGAQAETEAEHAEASAHAPLAEEVVEISLSPQALKNIGLDGENATQKITPTQYARTLAFPAMVADFPGRTLSKVPSTVAGIVTKIYHEPGVSVKPGEPLFDITLTHQEAMAGQLELLQLLKKREILQGEIQRVGELPEGMVPQKKRELGYDLAQLELAIANQKNMLTVQGLAAADVEKLVQNPDNLIHQVTIYVPMVSHHGLVSEHNPGHVKDWILVDSLHVNIGEMVGIGDPLCSLCDLCELTVRGEAFSFNEMTLTQALKQKTPVSLVFEGSEAMRLDGLHLRSIDNHIQPTNRTVSCYVDIENVIDSDQTETIGDFPTPRHYVQWKFKPGQRCEMHVETEKLDNVLVLPAEAVARRVHETFLFVWVGNTAEGLHIWKKVSVHVLFHAQNQVIIANDGSVFPGAKVASRGAEFLLAALDALNQGGAQKADPHAGCNH